MSAFEKLQQDLLAFPNTVIAGVVKSQPVEKIREAVKAGITILCNNYAQEGETLRAQLPEFRGQWHFIGHIQSRKAKELGWYHCVQSLDRIEVARNLPGPRDVLVQVNIGEEPQKSGVIPGKLDEFLDELAKLPGLRVRGLMAIPPNTDSPEGRRPYFRKMRDLFATHKSFDTLSMGMSDDYVIAAEEGSTLVRIGSALFGPRPVFKK